ncbi:hypothetical protein [Sphingobium sp. LF-16]|uniref:hypothetical protein n=1 Tax=Sphingobium sp. LF-16 TaxID=2185111 RepID=UPI0013DDC4BE|nr:hypothetical protein [Sphingobium sp. LF-16]
MMSALMAGQLIAGARPITLWSGLLPGFGLIRDASWFQAIACGWRLWGGEGGVSGRMPCYLPAFIANDMQKGHDKPDRIGNKDASAAFAQLFP